MIMQLGARSSKGAGDVKESGKFDLRRTYSKERETESMMDWDIGRGNGELRRR